MLRYKAWLDTRLWFFLALAALSAQVVALYVSYPMDPVTSYPNGALGVTTAEMTRLRTGEFRGYIWLRWFSTTMLLIWPPIRGTSRPMPTWRRVPGWICCLCRRRRRCTRLASARRCSFAGR